MNRQKILFVSASNVLNPGGYTTRVLSELAHISRRQVKLYYLPFLYYTLWRRPRDLRELRARAGTFATVLPVPILPTFKLGNVGRGIQLWAAVLTVMVVAKLFKVDIVHAHGIHAAHIAVIAKKAIGLKVIFDMHGLEPEELSASGLPVYKKQKLIARAQLVEAECVKQVDRIICVSEAMSHHLKNRYATTAPIQVVPCAVDTNRFSFTSIAYGKMREQHGMTDRMVLVYAGSLQSYQCIEDMIRLFAFVKEHIPRAFFMVYTMDPKQELERLLCKYSIRACDYSIEFMTHELVGKHLVMSDVGLLLRENLPLNNVASPTKLAEYFSSGLPVIATPYIGDIPHIFSMTRLGFLTKMGNPFEENMINFLNDVGEHRTEWGCRCSQFAKDVLSWAVQSDKIVQVYRELDNEAAFTRFPLLRI